MRRSADQACDSATALQVNYHVPPATVPGAADNLQELDEHVRINQREYLTELFLLPAFRTHPMRTMDKAEASVFVIGYAHGMARMASQSPGCEAYGVKNEGDQRLWEDQVRDVFARDEYFKRNGGKDFIFLHSRYKWDVSSNYNRMLNGGPVITTFDRYSSPLSTALHDTWSNGRVIVTPYVSSTDLDMRHEKPPKEKSIRFYFRGNMNRRSGGRSELPNLSKVK